MAIATKLKGDGLGPSYGGAGLSVDAPTLNRYPDVLQAAWGLSDAEFETILHLHQGAMRQWRNHELCFAAVGLARLTRLFLFHEALRFHAMGHPPHFATYLRRVWHADSVIGARSIIAALGDAEEDALKRLEDYVRGAD